MEFLLRLRERLPRLCLFTIFNLYQVIASKSADNNIDEAREARRVGDTATGLAIQTNDLSVISICTACSHPYSTIPLITRSISARSYFFKT